MCCLNVRKPRSFSLSDSDRQSRYSDKEQRTVKLSAFRSTSTWFVFSLEHRRTLSTKAKEFCAVESSPSLLGEFGVNFKHANLFRCFKLVLLFKDINSLIDRYHHTYIFVLRKMLLLKCPTVFQQVLIIFLICEVIITTPVPNLKMC